MFKNLNKDIDETWIDWAIEMIEAGFESQNLFELAGTTPPYNQFKLQDLTDRVFNDFNLDYKNEQIALGNYFTFLCTQLISKKRDILQTLRILKNLCLDQGYDDRFMPFYLLYYAKEDLIDMGYQHYWNGATAENIDQIVLEQCKLIADKKTQP